MTWLLESVHESVVLRLFLVIGVGYLIGEIKFPGNFRLGIAAVLFAGLGFGALDGKFTLPADLQSVGLALFVYCVGLEAGPGFFQSFKRDGIRLNVATAIALAAAALITFVGMRIFDVPREMLAGLFCGALTNTPALGAVTEAIARYSQDAATTNAAVVGYGVAYPFAVLSVLLLFQVRLRHGSHRTANVQSTQELPQARTILVQRVSDNGPWSADAIRERTGAILTRYKTTEGTVHLVQEEMDLPLGLSIIAVGQPAQLEAATELLGMQAAEQIQENLAGFEVHRYFVSNPLIAGRPLGRIGLEKLGAVVSRVRRADVDLAVSDDTMLQLGDRVRVVTYKENEPAIRKFFGNSLHALSETGYVSFAFGIALGLLLGLVPIPLPGMDQPVRLGLAGGPLIVALILGRLGRTGPFIWNAPLPMNLSLRQFGILIFLACAGVKAGAVLPSAIRTEGVFLVLFGAFVAIAANAIFWLALRFPKPPPLEQQLGASAGLQTQPAILSFAAQKLTPGPVNLAYATVYPLAIILKIVLAQLLLAW